MKKIAKKVIFKFCPEVVIILIKEFYYPYSLRRMNESDEPDLCIIKKLIKKGDNVIDIGANVGLYTKCISTMVGDDGIVFSVEPIPTTFRILKNNIKKLHLNNVKCLNVAISSSDGYAFFDIPQNEYGVPNFYRATLVNEGDDNKIKVDTYKIDSLFGEQDIKFIKCDVEGHELECIKGAIGLIRSRKPAWLVEINDNPDVEGSNGERVVTIFHEEGYEPYVYCCGSFRRRIPGDKNINNFFLTSEHFRHIQGFF
ncbi:MAG: FkbM family methyltransferase [Desulfuromonadales bacterium]|nr:FkbM family methyltransferase [Desulfuromonadales bacterium]